MAKKNLCIFYQQDPEYGYLGYLTKTVENSAHPYVSGRGAFKNVKKLTKIVSDKIKTEFNISESKTDGIVLHYSLAQYTKIKKFIGN